MGAASPVIIREWDDGASKPHGRHVVPRGCHVPRLGRRGARVCSRGIHVRVRISKGESSQRALRTDKVIYNQWKEGNMDTEWPDADLRVYYQGIGFHCLRAWVEIPPKVEM